MNSVDVSDKSNNGIQTSLNKIFKEIGIPVGYTSEQLTELVKNPSIMQVNQSLLNLLVAMNKLQKDDTQKRNLDLAIERIKNGIIDEPLINQLSSELINYLQTEQLQQGSVVNLEGFKNFLTNSGIPDSVIINVEQIISHHFALPSASSSASSPSASSSSASSSPSEYLLRYAKPTASSIKRGGVEPFTIVIGVIILILVIGAIKDKFSNTVSNIIKNCFSSKSSSGGKKSKRMQNKSKRHRKSRRQRKSKRRQ